MSTLVSVCSARFAFRPASRPGLAHSGKVVGFDPRRFTPTRPGLAPAGEFLLVDAKRNQKRLLNVHAHRGMQRHPTRCVHRRRTEQKYCPIRARASWLGPRSTLEGRNAARVLSAPAAASAGVRRDHAACRVCSRIVAQHGIIAEGIRLGHAECSVHSHHDARARMGQPYGSVPPAGEHTVPNAFPRPGAHGRSKTFLGPFGVYQKDLARRGETRPGGSRLHPRMTRRTQQTVVRIAASATHPSPATLEA